jgi:putative addiction module component (TIGR02574 family)
MLAAKEILDLSIAERIQLAEDLWDSVAQVPESLVITDQERDEIDHRLDLYHKNPNAGSPWSVVRDRIKNRT